MCPPSPESIHPAVELDEYSTDEAVFESLMRLKTGCPLPLNVFSGVDPYQFTPSNLPDGSKIEIVNNLDDLADTSAMDDQSQDYVLRGDYLELDDLAIPLSPTTSADSSCMTRSMASEDFFDLDALLCELGDDNGDHDSRIKLNLSAPAELKEAATQQTTLGIFKANTTLEREPGDRCNNSNSNEVDSSSSSSSSSEGSFKGGKKHQTKKRKIIKYLCFLAS